MIKTGVTKIGVFSDIWKAGVTTGTFAASNNKDHITIHLFIMYRTQNGTVCKIA